MLVNMLVSLVFIITVFVIAIPFAAVLTTVWALLTGRYLNSYFVVSKKSNGAYELHHQPAVGFYYTNGRKFYKKTKQAISRFQEKYPNCKLIASTLTQQSAGRKGSLVDMSPLPLTLARLRADFLIICNLASYRKVSGRWQVVKLIRAVQKNVLIRYQIKEIK